MSRLGCLSIVLALLAVSGPVRAETGRLVLNNSYLPPISAPDGSGVLDAFYRELSRRLGIQIEIQQLPAERSLTNANNGIDDGDVCRIAGLEKNYPNMIAVPEVVMRYEHVVFSRRAEFTVTGPDDLRPYDVGVIKGWKIVEWNTTKARSVTLVDEPHQLFEMLRDGRIDLAIMERLTGTKAIGDLGIDDIKVLEPAFLAGDWFLYLNRKHEALVPRIAAEIRHMKDDGTYRRIFTPAGDRPTGDRAGRARSEK